jgi:phosphatidylinositol 4-kinase
MQFHSALFEFLYPPHVIEREKKLLDHIASKVVLCIKHASLLPSLVKHTPISPLFSSCLLYWNCVPIPTAISFLTIKGTATPILQNYVFKVLDSSSDEEIFPYIPQLVQALRHDNLGFVEKYILGTSKSSSLFAHQIIWNMKANMYSDWETMTVISIVQDDVSQTQ